GGAAGPRGRGAGRLASDRFERAIARLALYLVVGVLALLFAMPLIWTVSTSLKSVPELFVFPPQLFPQALHFENFPRAWTFVPFGAFYANTAMVTVLGTLGAVLSSCLVAYGFARRQFPG